MGLPRKLGNAALALGLDQQKDKEGEALIRFFSIPRKAKKGEMAPEPLWNEPEDFPEKFELFRRYCENDVRTEGAVAKRTVRLSDYEQSVYVLDARINARGVRIDRASAVAALELVDKAKVKLDARLATITGNNVQSCTQVAKLTEWVVDRGVVLKGLAKDDILAALELVDLPQDVREALILRQDASKSSTSKLKAFLNRASADDRMRQTYIYHAASTGRFSNVGANVSNLPRPRATYEDAELDTARLFEAFRASDPDLIVLLYGPELGRPLHLVSDALRGFLWAAPGKEFVAVDYSGIEGAVAAWMVDETWTLEAMREIIVDPEAPDLYRRAAAAIMNMTTDVITKKHPLRQSVGKTSTLALGYGSGVAGFVAMAKNYNVNLHALFEPVWAAAPEDVRSRAEKRYARCLTARDKVMTHVLSREAWLACEIIKIRWRAEHGRFTAGWDELGEAMRNAVRHPGQKFDACKVTYMTANGFLWCRLPSGRCLAYGSPKLKDQVWAKVLGDDGLWPEQAETMGREEAEKLAARGKAKIEGATSPAVTALAVNSTTQKYERFGLYSGLGFENVVQAVARDILVHGMLNTEKANLNIVMHCYDEIVVEVPKGSVSEDDLSNILCDLPDWALGLPLTAHGFRSKRYKKG
jgi:DNA polymerase